MLNTMNHKLKLHVTLKASQVDLVLDFVSLLPF